MLKIEYLMLVVLLKKTDYNTKISSVDGKIAKNESNIQKLVLESLTLFFLGYSLFDGDGGYQAYLIFQPVDKHLKRLPILIIFYHGNLKDYLLKVLNHLQHLIIVLLQH